jgi:hypothetical protein
MPSGFGALVVAVLVLTSICAGSEIDAHFPLVPIIS